MTSLRIAVAHYPYGLPRDTAAEYNAGPLDLFVAVYFPYADYFVTDHPGQTKVVRAIAAQVGISVRLSSYDGFVEQMLKE